jgi:cob(I)alamin adenosyltransferase
MVRLTRIYTRTGDEGSTRLGDMSEVAKTHPRVAAYGDVDELNSALGVARAAGVGSDVDLLLARVQNELFDLGADLSVPGAGGDRLRVTTDQVTALEHACDRANESLEDLTSFVLPGGTSAAAALHHARTICRRAERSVVALRELEPEAVNPAALAYLNRLSDLLFILARQDNHRVGTGDVLWEPGETRGDPTVE